MITNKLKHLEPEFLNSKEYKTLNKGQKEFFTHFFDGENVFLTGPAGTGKSYCIQVLFSFLNRQNVFVGKTALTGVAALNIGGSTIHSWAGLGLADEDADSLARKAFSHKKARERMEHTSILFIDEISMASADLLNKLDYVMKVIRSSHEPFGGVQVIFSGDFLQLPPVFRGFGDQLNFAFKSHSWSEANIHTVHLNKLVRQDENTPFAKLLQDLRFGKVADLSLLETRIDAKLNLPIDPIKIFCKNIDIDFFNLQRYNAITGPERRYLATNTGNPNHEKFFDKNCPAPSDLKLKIGAQVMLLVNLELEAGLVNGSMGVVDGFSILGPIVKFTNGERTTVEAHKWEIKEQELDVTGKMRYKVVATRKQIPLKLAWATSVHKQQGCTLDHAVIDLTNAFEHGQVYVALSRVKTLEGLSLTAFNPKKIKAHPDCLEFYDSLKKKKK